MVVQNKVFDGNCDMCLSDLDMICENGGSIDEVINGRFVVYRYEIIKVWKKFKLEEIKEDIKSCLQKKGCRILLEVS